jgi:hypothetical protein
LAKQIAVLLTANKKAAFLKKIERQLLLVTGCRLESGHLPLGPIALRHTLSRALPFSVFGADDIFISVADVRQNL